MAKPPGSVPARDFPPLGNDWLRGAVLFAAVLLAYGPVWQAGFVWDDRAMLTANPCIVGPLGLRQIWTTHFADICPLTLSALWLEHALWGLSPAPYHVVNVLLHATGALLLWRVLRELRAPGAWLGAALWALHPVEVESVAWVTEMKNTLSGVFFLASVWCFLRAGGEDRPRLFYGLSLLGAALAMAAKSSTVVLPVVLGLCSWWREGGVSRRRAASLGPLVLMAVAAGALSLWTQGASLAAASGAAAWARPWPARLAAGGEAVWFYAGKLLWPRPLMAVYPRWQVEAGHGWEWLGLSGVVAVTVCLWRWRGSPWARAGVFVWAYFVVSLLPALGLLDNTIFRYSLVFDHFQYLASLGPLALAGVGAARLLQRALPGRPGWQAVLAGGALLALGAADWRRSEVYRDEETFWTDALAKNPACWIGHGNLGSALLLKGRVDDARAHYEEALAINPGYAEARSNLGVIFLRQGNIDEAVAQLERAVVLDPRNAEAHNNLGNARLAEGQIDQAVDQYERALAINPDYPVVYFNLGNARYAEGRTDEAIDQYEHALAIQPDYAEARGNLGNALMAKRRPAEAISQYKRALALNPGYAEAHNNLGLALVRTARFDEAVVQFEETLRLRPDFPGAQNNLTVARTLAARRARSP